MIFLVDKPAGMTSQQVVSKIKHAFAVKRKIGHTGTLDPMCTGLLPVLTDGDTKLTQFFPHEKEYLATIRFGLKTDTGDITGTVLETSAAATYESFCSVLPSFLGELKQIPPMYSAVHLNGRRLYEYARSGQDVERPSRTVRIFSITPRRALSDSEFQFSVSCSTGTYIRTLCEEIGSRIGKCATMAALRRTASNGFRLESAYTLEKLISLIEGGDFSVAALSAETAFSDFPAYIVPPEGECFYWNGGVLSGGRFSPAPFHAGLGRAYSAAGRFLGLIQFDNTLSGKAVYRASDS